MKKGFKIKGLEDKKVLITGGLGFIGSNLAHRCVKLGADVTLYGRSLKKARNIKGIRNKVKFVKGDIREEGKIEKVVPEKDVIFHLGAQTSNFVSMENPQLDLDINCNGTLNILEASRKYNDSTCIIFSGTVAEIGKIAKLPVNENLATNPLSIYDANKLACEKYLQIYHNVYGLKTVTLRLANIFGERQELINPHRGVLNNTIKKAIFGEPITVYDDGKFLRDYNYVQNVVDAFLLAFQSSSKARGKYYLIGTGRGISFKDMVVAVNETVKRIMNRSTTIKHVPFPEDKKKLDIGDVVVDFSRFNKDIGWYPKVSFEEGLERTVSFYAEKLKEYT